MGHNFRVERHLRFEVEMGEKAWSTPLGTIHWSREFCKAPLHFMQNLLIKILYGLCKSGRGSADLQLSYSNLGALQFNFLEINPVKVCLSKMFCTLASRARARAGVARRPRRGPAGPARRGRPTSVGPCAMGPSRVEQPSRPYHLAPRVARASTGRTDHIVCPLASPPYSVCARRLAVPMP
jgi:hypothetical protein